MTDSTEAYTDMVERLGSYLSYFQLYKSYLSTFKINLEEHRAS